MATTKTKATDVLKLHLEVSGPRLRELQHFSGYNPDEDDTIKNLMVLSKGFDDALAKVATNPDFSPTGRENARRKIANELSTALERWHEKHPAVLGQRIESETAALRRKTEGPPPSDAERLRREIRYSEIRRSLEKLDSTMLALTYGSLPPEAQAALRDAPPRVIIHEGGVRTEPFVPQSVVDEQAFREAEAANPEAAGHISDLQEIHAAYLALSGALENEVENILLDPGSIPRSRGAEPEPPGGSGEAA